MAGTPDAIAVSHLRKSYATRDGSITTLDDVSFSIAPQEFVSVLGPSGCGKTTVLKIVAGLVPQSGGTVTAPAVRIRSTARPSPARNARSASSSRSRR